MLSQRATTLRSSGLPRCQALTRCLPGTVPLLSASLKSGAQLSASIRTPHVPICRPPNAFTRKRDFSAAEPGRVLLLEYMEQQASLQQPPDQMQLRMHSHPGHTSPPDRAVVALVLRAVCVSEQGPACLATSVLQPPLLNRPGMGAKLVTYYRKRDASDADHQRLKQGEPPALSVWVHGLRSSSSRGLCSWCRAVAGFLACREAGDAAQLACLRCGACLQRSHAGEWALCSHWEMMMTRLSWVSAAALRVFA